MLTFRLCGCGITFFYEEKDSNIGGMEPVLTYNCVECDQIFQDKFEFLQHKNIHTNETPFMCVICKKSSRSVKEYAEHIKCMRVDACEGSNKNKLDPGLVKIDENKCRNCSEIFDNTQDLKRHICTKHATNKCLCCSCQFNCSKMKKSSENNSIAFKCENCNKNFSTSLRFSKHACFVSSSEENFKCSCSQIFTKVSAFKAHVGEKPYGCCSCSMQFNTITNLIRHIRTHTKQKPYICKDCGRGFSQSANLRNHLSLHLGIQAIKCTECDFSCKTLNGLLKHKKKHNEGLNHQNYIDGRKKSTNKSTCPICNKQFMFKRNMGMHMKIHNNKVSLCTECGKVFDSKSKLTSHYKACHREPSMCKTCGKVFASAVLLSAHEKIHVSDKLYSCDFCQKTFSVRNYLVQHMKTHSNRKQFSCSKCGKLFKVAVSLKYHSNICTSLNIPV